MNEPATTDPVLTIATPGASVKVHDLGPHRVDHRVDQPVASLPPLLISHATGFHGRCYRPIADELASDFRAWAIDHRGHGLTAVPAGWATNWHDCGVDTATIGRHMAPDGGLVGFGHSMGGATLLIAAAIDPTLFSRLVLMEPIAPPPPLPGDEPYDPNQNRLVASALRRRRVFESYESAYENFSTKPPMSSMEPRVLREYVDGGFRPVSTESNDDLGGGVELRCTPEFEASVFIAAHSTNTWSLLPTITTPTLVIAGHVRDDEPSSWAEGIAERLPNGELIICDDQTHFGPFSHVADTATLIAG